MELISFLLDHLYLLHEIPMYYFEAGKPVYMTGKDCGAQNPFQADDSLYLTLSGQADAAPCFVRTQNEIYGFCPGERDCACILGPVSSLPMAAAVLSILNQQLNGQLLSSYDLIRSFDSHAALNDGELSFYHFEKSENEKTRLSYSYEKALMTAFSNGDEAFLESLERPGAVFHVGQLANTSYKQLEYTVVSGITMYARAAIEGGADPYEVYDMTDLYIQKLPACRKEAELIEIMVNVKTALFRMVQAAKESEKSFPYIEACKQFVASHLYKPFTLEEAAAAAGVSRCYLSHQFSKKQGISLSRYIQEKRIAAAQNMLKYSDQPIAAIASYLCFDSQSHFGSVFRKITGETPVSYRRKHLVGGAWDVVSR